MSRPSNREVILDAFESILIHHGATEATLDAIAETAGVSKGGLLYHFPSKSDLLAGFGERLLKRIDAAVADAPKDPEAVIRWYLDPEPRDEAEATLWRTILAALHVTESGLEGLIASGLVRYSTPLSVLQPVLAERVRLIGDGLFLNSLVGVEVRPEFGAVVESLVAETRAG